MYTSSGMTNVQVVIYFVDINVIYIVTPWFIPTHAHTHAHAHIYTA